MVTQSSLKGHGQEVKQHSLLLVDDNATTLRLLEQILTKEGYRTVTAVNGIEAMRTLHDRAHDFDAIILDRMMPELDGIEVTRRMLADPVLKYIPIVMQTAADKPEEISEGIKAGVFYYLTKPVERKTLVSVVASAVKERTQGRVLRTEMQRYRMGFSLINLLKASFRTLEEAESLASFLANLFPDPDRALNGTAEILVNAVEHGNLRTTYDDKTELMDTNAWREEVTRRLEMSEHKDKYVTVIFEKKNDTCYLQVTDQGKGFAWKSFLQFDPSRASHNHGRGIAMANMIAFDRLVYNEQGNQVTAVMNPPAKESDNDPYWGAG